MTARPVLREIIAGQRRVFLCQKIMVCVLVDRLGQRRPKAAEVRAAFGGVLMLWRTR